MPLSITTITLLLQLAMYTEYIKGIERVIVGELGGGDDVLISNDEDIPAISVIGS